MFTNSVSDAALEKALSGTWQRMQLIGTNIANEDTPGYKAKRVSFESILQRQIDAIGRSRSMDKEQAVRSLEELSSKVYEDPAAAVRADGNNVSLNNEQIELARVQIQYQALQQKLGGHYSMLKYAIGGGR